MDHGEVSWDILTHGFIKNVNIAFYFLNPNLTIFTEIQLLFYVTGRHGGLMTSGTLDLQLNMYKTWPGLLGSVFWGKTLYTHTASLHPGV